MPGKQLLRKERRIYQNEHKDIVHGRSIDRICRRQGYLNILKAAESDAISAKESNIIAQISAV